MLEQNIHDDAVWLDWFCHACSARWPATYADAVQVADRRTGPLERRRAPRKDRRSR
jgi:hypothetical protein